MTRTPALDRLLDHIRRDKKLFWPSIEKNMRRHPELFRELGEPMSEWADSYLGAGFEKTLADGYAAFCLDVNRSQAEYEKTGRYKHDNYDEVHARVYDNPEFMKSYHWGVFVTTFAWEHHLRLYRFFRDYFLDVLPEEGALLELGAGSGIWGMLAAQARPRWRITGVDISETSVAHADGMIRANGLRERIELSSGDALSYRGARPASAIVSCFLLEHLERPESLVDSVSRNLEPGGYAFLTAALTASEIDHIYEIQRETEVALLAEERGLRLVALYSASPAEHPRNSRFLPRSVGFVLQKRAGDIW